MPSLDHPACRTTASIFAAILIAANAVAQAPSTPVAGQPGAPGAAAAPSGADTAAPAGDQPDFKPEELEQMLAPVALYPDDLLAQVLMASTYPVEVVEADRFAKANKGLKDQALADELDKKSWDESVKSLVNFPDVLSTMSENLSTTVKIGDAFIGQQKEVMATVQKLRGKAKETGNLKSSQEQNVSTTVQGGTEVIVIESSSPDVVYVPQYNPTVVYGTWPYPAYPPYPYYPAGYVAGTALAFTAGVALGACWSNAWGNCNWGGGDVNIDVDRNVNRNSNRNRSVDRSKAGQRNGSFKHNPSHRQGASYRNQSAANRVGAGQSSNRASTARNDYRGRAEAGRSDLARGSADSFKGAGGAGRGDTRAPGAANRAGNSGGVSLGERSGGAGSNRGSAISDAGRGGQQARQASSRGSSSRQASPSRSSGSRPSGGGSRGGGGGGSRGGGGGGRGGGRR